ncbi:glycosyltransferase family 4 protein [Sporosarcina sp. YIM B06819]|uniref:glycosyltransferase family 4 protein n=1 Tax=Sporosarcina sp. YIM B06819 TaxID=3081769 RepID=UPI00298CE8A0|nr:glycosyltransferase family 4 protein [Sporosarcina sp. YIM B06819]
MKILIIHHTGLMGGGTLSCFDIIKALEGNKHSIVLALPPGESAARQLAKNNNINILNDTVVPLVFGHYNGGANILKVLIRALPRLRYIKRWEKILRREKPDVVLLNSMIQWPMISILKKLNIKSVCFVRETIKGKRRGLINRFIAAKLQNGTGVSFLSEFDKKQWDLPERVNQIVIPDVVDVDNYSNGINKEDSRNILKLKNDVFYILYSGGMSKIKGAETIVRALKHCKGKKIELLFLGNSGNDLLEARGVKKIKYFTKISFIKKLYRFIEENGMKDKVKFLGVQTNMNYWYSACDVVVFPAEEAHQARPIYEAGVFKKPIIASDFPNYYEYLKPGVSGLVFKPGDHNELAQAIENLYDNSVLYDDIGNNNYLLMDKFHNSKSVNKKVNNFIESINSL